MGILGLLQYAPMSGYGLKKVFDMSINHFWSASLSQIYRELSWLEANGHVTSDIERQDARPDKRIYTITETGAREFAEWLNAFPGSFGAPRRDEFLLRLFFGAAMDKKLLRRELDDFILMIEKYGKTIREDRIPDFSEVLAQIGEGRITDREALRRASLYWRFTVRRFELVAEASVRWARECIESLEENE